MATTRRSPLAIIFVTIFIDLVGFGIVIPILPLYAQRFGASPLVIGLLLAIYSFMQCICAPLLGKLSDRIGRRPVLLVSILGSAVGFLLMGLAGSLWMLFVARIIDGITGGNISTAQAYIADITPPEQRSKRMGLIGAAFGLGFIFGPAIGGLLSRVSLAAPFYFAAALAACNATALFFALPESLPEEHRGRVRERVSLAQVFHEAGSRSLLLVMATYFVTTMAFSLLTATYPLFTQRRFGFGAMENGYVFAAQGVLGAIIQGGLLGWLLKKASDRRLVAFGALALAVSFFALPLSLSTTALFLATAGMAASHGLVAAPLHGMASRSVGGESQGRVLGLMQSAASAARIVGPVLGGWLLNIDAARGAAWFGRTPYWVASGVMVVGFGLAMAL